MFTPMRCTYFLPFLQYVVLAAAVASPASPPPPPPPPARATFSQTKTIQIEYLSIDANDMVGTISDITLGCLIEEDAMAFPVRLEYSDFEMMERWWWRYVSQKHLYFL